MIGLYLVLFLGFFLILLCFSVAILPIWVIVNIANAAYLSKPKKTAWILACLCTGIIGSLPYGLYVTESKRLWQTTFFTTLSFLVLAAIGYLTPSIRQGIAKGYHKYQVENFGETKGSTPRPQRNTAAQTANPGLEYDNVILEGLSSQFNDTHKAIEIFSSAITLDANRCEGWIHRGGAKIQNGDKSGGRADIERGLDIIETEITKNPTNDRMYYFRATALRQLKEYDRALTAIKQAIELNPKRMNYPTDLKVIEMEKKHAN